VTDARGTPDGADLRVEPAKADKSIGELLGDVTTDLSTLMRQEIDLAKEEIKIQVNQAGKAGAGFGAAAVLGLLAGVAAVMTLGFALDTFMWRWLAFLVVTAVLGGIAAFLAVVSKQKLAQVNPVPEKTIETLKEDKQWLSELKS
jgi:MFS family permease